LRTSLRSTTTASKTSCKRLQHANPENEQQGGGAFRNFWAPARSSTFREFSDSDRTVVLGKHPKTDELPFCLFFYMINVAEHAMPIRRLQKQDCNGSQHQQDRLPETRSPRPVLCVHTATPPAPKFVTVLESSTWLSASRSGTRAVTPGSLASVPTACGPVDQDDPTDRMFSRELYTSTKTSSDGGQYASWRARSSARWSVIWRPRRWQTRTYKPDGRWTALPYVDQATRVFNTCNPYCSICLRANSPMWERPASDSGTQSPSMLNSSARPACWLPRGYGGAEGLRQA